MTACEIETVETWNWTGADLHSQACLGNMTENEADIPFLEVGANKVKSLKKQPPDGGFWASDNIKISKIKLICLGLASNDELFSS